jgi:hypothetical protein
MKRRQAKRCVVQNLRHHRRMYPWATWKEVLRTLERHHLIFVGGKGHAWQQEDVCD